MINRRLSYIIKDQNPVLLPATEIVQNACKVMQERHVGSVLVVDEHQKLVGIFTGRDAIRLLAKNANAGQIALEKAMTREPVTISSEHKAIDALRAMSDGGFRHVPIVDRGRIWGVVSRADFKGIEIDRLDEEEALAERIR